MTCLSITNIVKFKRTDIYNPNGIPRTYVYIRGVGNTYLRPARKLLNDYWKWIQKYQIRSKWMFPSFPSSLSPHDSHIESSRFYNILKNIRNRIGLHNLSNSSARKTGALQIYQQTHNLGIVMHLLHQRDLPRTKQFFGLNPSCDHTFLHKLLDRVAFH